MISHLKGTVTDKFENAVVIDVNGVGYEVMVPAPELDTLLNDETVKLHTYFSVRENAQELYGFSKPEAKYLFEQLISVNGVGPKVALSILSLDDADQIAHAIADGNVEYIKSASGVGKKGAEKIILELKDKVVRIGARAVTKPLVDDDATEALLALGYSAVQVQQALTSLDKSLSTEDRVKAALKELSR